MQDSREVYAPEGTESLIDWKKDIMRRISLFIDFMCSTFTAVSVDFHNKRPTPRIKTEITRNVGN